MNLFKKPTPTTTDDIEHYQVTCPKCGSTLNFTEYSVRYTAGFQSTLYLPCPNCDNQIYLKVSDDPPTEDPIDTPRSSKHKYLLPLLSIPPILYIINKYHTK